VDGGGVEVEGRGVRGSMWWASFALQCSDWDELPMTVQSGRRSLRFACVTHSTNGWNDDSSLG